jgi:hypothetical protein
MGGMDNDKAMQAYMKMGTPGENHTFLKKFVGDWNISTKAWMQPGAEPSMNQGTCTGEMILDGRFLIEKYKGMMMGQPFEGMQIIGYDNMKQKFVTFWIDNSSTAFYMMDGMLDKAGTTLTDTGMWPDPMTGGTSRVRDVIHMVSPTEYTYEMFMTGPDGKEFKSLENHAVMMKKMDAGK